MSRTAPEIEFPMIDIEKLTDAERLAIEASTIFANRMLRLDPVHQDERAEAVTHIHALQVSILARVAYPRDRRGA